MKRDVKTANDFASDLGLKMSDDLYDAAVMWFLKGNPIDDSDYDKFNEDVYNNRIGEVHKKLLNRIQTWAKTNSSKTSVASPPKQIKKPKIVATTTLIPKSSITGTVKSGKTTLKPKITPTKLFCAATLNGPNIVPFSLPWDLDSNISKAILSNIAIIDKNLKLILKSLVDKKKIDAKIEEQRRLDAENERRSRREFDLEHPDQRLSSSASRILTPIKGIFDKISRFLLFTFLGKAFGDVVKWISDPKNKDKVKTIGKFLKDWWPALLGSYLIFGTGLARFIRSITSILAAGLKFLIRRPLKAAAIVGGVAAAGAAANYFFQNKNSSQANKPSTPDATPTTQKLPKYNSGGKILASNLTLGPDGFVSDESGVNITGAGPDTQLIAARPGEIVMNKEAVDAIGADKLLELNRRYGGPGANKPSFTDNIQMAAGGGIVGRIASMFSNKPQPPKTVKPISINLPDYKLPEMKSALESIKYTEGTIKSKNPYDTLFGFGSAPIRRMSVKELIDLQTKDILPKRLGGGNVGFPKNSSGNVMSAASGAYQFMPDTLRMLVNNKILKMHDIMNESNQDKAASELMKLRGVSLGVLRREGMSKNVMDKLAPEWASFPTLSGASFYNQPAKSHKEIQTFYNQNLKTKITSDKKKLEVKQPQSKMKFKIIDLPPITQPLVKPTSSVAAPTDVSLFPSKSPERRGKTMKTYGIGPN